MMDIKIGQTVWIKKINNAARYLDNKNSAIEDYISSGTIVSIGRKWFTVNSDSVFDERFDISTGHNDGKGYCSNYIAYQSKQDIYDEVEYSNLKNKISHEFCGYGQKTYSELALAKLRLINEIINS